MAMKRYIALVNTKPGMMCSLCGHTIKEESCNKFVGFSPKPFYRCISVFTDGPMKGKKKVFSCGSKWSKRKKLRNSREENG